MTTHKEIHDTIQKWDRNYLEAWDRDVMDILETLNDKLAGIEERLRDHDLHIDRLNNRTRDL